MKHVTLDLGVLSSSTKSGMEPTLKSLNIRVKEWKQEKEQNADFYGILQASYLSRAKSEVKRPKRGVQCGGRKLRGLNK